MNTPTPNSPEDRLLDELLREQARGADEAFLQQIENAVDAKPAMIAKSSSGRNYGRFAIAAGLTLAAGGIVWSSLQNRHAPPSVGISRVGTMKAQQAALELEKLNQAVRDQEEKVEERRKMLATIAARSASGENVDVLPSLIGKLMYVKDESLAWVIIPRYGSDGGKFPFNYEDSNKGINKTSPATPGDVFFTEGVMRNRFKFLGSVVRRESNPKINIETDVTYVRIEDQRSNKKGVVYEFPAPLNDQRKNEHLKYDRTAIFSLEALGYGGQEFKVEENTTFSLPPGSEKKDYFLKSITPAGVVVEMVDGGQVVEIRKGAVPAGEALAALAGNSAGSPQGDIREDAIRPELDVQDYVDAKKNFETDQQELQSMKQRLAALTGEKEERSEIVEGGLKTQDGIKKQNGGYLDNDPSNTRRVSALAAGSSLTLPDQNSDLSDLSSLSSAAGSGGLGGDSAEYGRGNGHASGQGAGQLAENAARHETSPAKAPAAGLGGFVLPSEDATASEALVSRFGRGQPVPRIVPPPRGTQSSDQHGKFIHQPQETPTGDQYGKFIEQPWKSSTQDPLSTFSIDVDTASYSNVRRMIQEGREIPKDAVRIEECINAFSYKYAQPQGDAPFAVGATLAVCPWAPDHQLVRVAIKGREIEKDKRPASNLVFLIDVSGSMQSPDKLPLLKQSMQTLVDQLDERDRVAIVVYAGTEGVALPSTRLDADGRSAVTKALAKLEAGGSTNGGAGITRAYELAMAQKIEGGVNRVILATDGDFNVGVTGQESLVELVKSRAKGGVYLTVLGFGTGNLNDAMMDAITRDGNGNYFYIDSEREGKKVFLQNLSGTLVTIAKDVKIQVEFNPAKVGQYRLIGYANRVLRNEDFNNDKVDAGDIGAGHTVTAFYELAPGTASPTDGLKYQQTAEKPAAPTDEWLTVKLRYKHPDGDESRKIEFPLTGAAPAADKTDADFQFATAAAVFGMKLRGMDEVRDFTWDQVAKLAQPGLANDLTEDRAEFFGLVKKLGGTTRSVPPAADVIHDR